MKRGRYVRITAYLVPFDFPFTNDLGTAAMLSIPLWITEGWLNYNLTVGTRIHLTVRVREGELCLGTFRSGSILQIQGEYVVTREGIYQFQAVPPSPPETFCAWA
jgi:hypothetical protein